MKTLKNGIGLFPMMTLVILAIVGFCFLSVVCCRVALVALNIDGIRSEIRSINGDAETDSLGWTDARHDRVIELNAEISEMQNSNDPITSYIAKLGYGENPTLELILRGIIIALTILYLLAAFVLICYFIYWTCTTGYRKLGNVIKRFAFKLVEALESGLVNWLKSRFRKLTLKTSLLALLWLILFAIAYVFVFILFLILLIVWFIIWGLPRLIIKRFRRNR